MTYDMLTVREQAVLNALVAYPDSSNEDIARLLEIKMETVKTHLRSIRKKYGLTSRTGLAVARMREKQI